MDLKAAYSSALSSLSVTQYQSAVTSNNIANANVEGYSAQTVNTVTKYSDGMAVGVGVASVSTYFNENLYNSYVSANSETQYANTTSTYMNYLVDSFGTVDDDNSLPDQLTDLETALADLIVTPESQSVKNTFLSEAEQVADMLNDLSGEVQAQRQNADSQIESNIASVNEALDTIHELNEEIALKTALGQDTSALEDTRRLALNTVSEQMDVSFFITGNNEMHVYTSSGLPLVDSHAHELSYNSQNNVNSTTSFDAITLDGKDVTSSISGGEIGALIDLRDEVLPAQQEELDALAVALADTLNAVMNTGAAYPGQSSITGQEVVSSTDAFSGTGTFRIVLNDEDGVATSVTDLDLSTYATVGDLVTDINAISGITATIDSNGQLNIQSDDSSQYIALSEMDSVVGTDNQGVSDYFGLNDLFTGTDASSISVRSDLLEDSTQLTIGSLSQDAGLSAGDVAITSGDASVAEALAEALNGPVSFSSAGGLDATTTTLHDYSSEILSNLALNANSAETEATTKALISEMIASDISNQSGVNLDEEAARLTVLENQFSASSQVISTLNDMFNSLLDAVS